MPKNYKKFTAFDRLTKEILAEWDRDFEGDMFIVKKQISFTCPLTDELVPQSKCLSCDHFYGWSSDKWIYCFPEMERIKSVRTQKKHEKKGGNNVNQTK